jgi:hypothetical protein
MRMPVTILMLSLAGASLAQADCVMPTQSVDIPDGASATLEQMTNASQAVRGYIGSLEEYTACLDAESAKLGQDDAANQRRALNVTRYNAAVQTMEDTAARMNSAIRAYNQAQSDD